jgi:hypothetical protein
LTGCYRWSLENQLDRVQDRVVQVNVIGLLELIELCVSHLRIIALNGH